jgi:ketosteroid isomerase-like protein
MPRFERIILIAAGCTLASLLSAMLPWSAAAQQGSTVEIPTGQQLVDLIAELDRKLVTAYSKCDLETFLSMMAPDVENYHDEVGRVVGREGAKKILVEGLCDLIKNGIQPRIELIAGSLEVYRMANVGALDFGRYSIWLRRPGEQEAKVGTFRTMTLWERRDGAWMVARHIAYAHEPVKQK